MKIISRSKISLDEVQYILDDKKNFQVLTDARYQEMSCKYCFIFPVLTGNQRSHATL